MRSRPRALARAWLVATFVLLGLGGRPAAAAAPLEHYLVGDRAAPRPDPVTGGLLLLGGGDRDDEAMSWFFARAGHGHVVVLSASYGAEIGDEFFHRLGGVASVETFVFGDREQTGDPAVADALARADGIFIAGGDQARYVRYWQDTPVARALERHVASGRPLAGTSAGLAILGEYLYGALDGGSIDSATALADPYGPAVTVVDGFLRLPLLEGVITDTHFRERRRLGRLCAFLVHAQRDRPADRRPLLGLGVDEAAAVAVRPDGSARVYATAKGGGAWLVDGSTLRARPPRAPFFGVRIRVRGVGDGGTLHLPDGAVERPAFERTYAVRGRELVVIR
jgi:beta-aspartyl-peptidase (threonine type)